MLVLVSTRLLITLLQSMLHQQSLSVLEFNAMTYGRGTSIGAIYDIPGLRLIYTVLKPALHGTEP